MKGVGDAKYFGSGGGGDDERMASSMAQLIQCWVAILIFLFFH